MWPTFYQKIIMKSMNIAESTAWEKAWEQAWGIRKGQFPSQEVFTHCK